MKILPVPDLVLNVRSRWRDEGRECEEKPWSPDIPKKEKEKKEKKEQEKRQEKTEEKRKKTCQIFFFFFLGSYKKKKDENTMFTSKQKRCFLKRGIDKT